MRRCAVNIPAPSKLSTAAVRGPVGEAHLARAEEARRAIRQLHLETGGLEHGIRDQAAISSRVGECDTFVRSHRSFASAQDEGANDTLDTIRAKNDIGLMRASVCEMDNEAVRMGGFRD